MMNAKRLAVVLVFCLLLLGVGRAAAWDIEWVDQFGNASYIGAYQTKTDATGVYVAGPVYPALPGQTGAGYDDIFLRKYSFDKQVMWTRQFGSADTDIISGFVTDNSGVYTAGTTFATLPGQTSAGGLDAYVRKYSANGDVLWTTQFGTAADDGLIDGGVGVGAGGAAIASHSSGLYVTGWTAGTFPGQPAGDGQDFYVAKLNPQSGQIVWLRQFGLRGRASNMNGGIGADDTGVYVTINNFPTDPANPIYLLRKYDFNGNLVWAQEHPHGPNGCIAYMWNIAVYAGRVYVVSQEARGFELDNPTSCQQPNDTTVIVGGLRAYDANGNLLWTRKIKGENNRPADDFTGAKTVWASAAGVFVAANLEGTFPGYVRAASAPQAQCPAPKQANSIGRKLDNDKLSNDKLSNDKRGVLNFDSLDAYVRRYNFNGDVIWTHQFGSRVFDIVTSIGTDATSVYASGGTSCVIVPGQTYTGGYEDAFIVRFDLEPTTLSGRTQLIVGQVETLRDRQRLERAEFNNLIEPLEDALTAIEREHPAVAERALEAFVRKVEAFERRGTLTAAESNALIAAANAIIAML